MANKAKFYRKHLTNAGTNASINNAGYITKIAVMSIYSKKLKIFSGTTEPIATKLDMLHLGLEFYKVFINDHVMTLTDFTARSILCRICRNC